VIRRSFAVGISTFACAVTAVVRVQADTSLTVSGPSCKRAPDAYAGVWAQLGVELRADGFSPIVNASPPTDAQSSPAPEVEILLHFEPCISHPRELDVLVTLRALDLWQHRVISLAEYDVGEPRLLALTIAEFVRTAHRDMIASQKRNEAASDDRSEPAISVVTSNLPPPAGDSSNPDFARVGVGVALDSRYFTAQSTALIGPRAVGLVPIGELAAVRVEAGIAWGTAEDSLGALAFSCPTASLGFDLATAGRDLRLELGPRVEVGYVSTSATPQQGAKAQRANGTIVLAGVGAALVGRIGTGWLGWLTLEAAQTLYGLRLRADERAPAGFSGPMIALQLGVARIL
jgi:hypothetical protein